MNVKFFSALLILGLLVTFPIAVRTAMLMVAIRTSYDRHAPVSLHSVLETKHALSNALAKASLPTILPRIICVMRCDKPIDAAIDEEHLG